jgi:hypothetical protein
MVIHFKSWKYGNTFQIRADVTRSTNRNLDSSLDKCLLNEDIGGFVGLYLLDDVKGIKDNKQIMKIIFGDKKI